MFRLRGLERLAGCMRTRYLRDISVSPCCKTMRNGLTSDPNTYPGASSRPDSALSIAILGSNPIQNRILNAVTLGGRIDRLRTHQCLTIEELASRSNLNKNTVNRIVRGVGQPNLTTFLKLCEALKISPNELLGATPESYRVVRRQITTLADKLEAGEHRDSWNDRLPGGNMSYEIIEISCAGQVESHSGEELLICLAGRIGVQIGDLKEELDEADVILFYGTESHRCYNAAPGGVSVALSVRT